MSNSKQLVCPGCRTVFSTETESGCNVQCPSCGLWIDSAYLVVLEPRDSNNPGTKPDSLPESTSNLAPWAQPWAKAAIQASNKDDDQATGFSTAQIVCAVLFIIACCAAIPVVGAGFIYGAKTATQVLLGLVIVVLVIATCVSAVGGCVLLIMHLVGSAAGASTRCPRCGRGGALICAGREVIAQERCHALVARQGASVFLPFGSKDVRGPIVGLSAHQQRAPVIKTTYKITYQCQFCHATKNVNKTEQVEDFG